MENFSYKTKVRGLGRYFTEHWVELEGSVAARNHIGGTAPEQVKKAIARLRKVIKK